MFLLQNLVSINFNRYPFDRDASGLYGPGAPVISRFNKEVGYYATSDDSFSRRNRGWAAGTLGWLEFPSSFRPMSAEDRLDIMLSSPLENASRNVFNVRSRPDPFDYLILGGNDSLFETFRNPTSEENPLDFTADVMTSTPRSFYTYPSKPQNILDLLMATIHNPSMIDPYDAATGFVAEDYSPFANSPIGQLNKISYGIMNMPSPFFGL